MGEGSSQLEIPVEFARPAGELGVAVLRGGVITRCLPEEGPTVNGGDLLVDFPFKQGVNCTVRRIHVKLPVLFEEKELQKTESKTVTKKKYGTLAEAEEAQGGKGGGFANSEDVVPIGYELRYEKRETTYNAEVSGPGFQVLTKETTVTHRSTLPVTATIIVRLTGPEGELWVESFEVPLHYQQGVAGSAIANGYIDAYVDLTNGITVDPDKQYGIGLYAIVPAPVLSLISMGKLLVNNELVDGDGEITLFYDMETGAPGK